MPVATPLVHAVRLVVPVALGALGAGWLLAHSGPRSDLLLRIPPVRAGPLLLAQPVAFAASAALARHFLAPGAPAPPAAALLLVLGALAATALLALVAVVPPRVLHELVLRRWRLPLLAVAAGVAVWRAAVAAEGLWGVLSGFTLQAAAILLRLTPYAITLDPSRNRLGLDRFLVEVSSECSGADGIGFVLLFVAMWLALARDRLRFPRALLLLPLGAAAALAANVVRLAFLLLAGAAGFVPVATAGLHSKLGWIGFTLLALGSILVAERSRFFCRVPRARTGEVPVPPEAAAYVLPLLATLVAALVGGLLAVEGLDLAYGLRVVAGGAALVVVRRSLPVPAFAPHWLPLAAGLAVGALWIALGGGEARPPPAALSSLPQPAQLAWIAARVAGAFALIPIVEELAFRGFLQPWVARRDFENADPRRPGWAGLAVSSLAFGVLHEQLALAVVAGLVFGLVRMWRGRLSDAVAAHAAANAAITFAVLAWGRWDLW